MIKTLLKRLVLINNGDVRDLVQLVKTLNTMLDQLGQLHCTLYSIGDSLDHDVVSGSNLSWGLLTASRAVKKLMSSLEITTDADSALDTNLIGWEYLLGFLDSVILISHL